MRPRLGGNLYGMAIIFVILFFIFAVFLPNFIKMREGIYRVSCKEIRKKVEVAVSNYDSNNTRSIVQSGKPIDLDTLKANGFLSDIQYCPIGGRFFFGPQGEILCSTHYPRVSKEEPTEPAKGGK